MAYVPVPNTLQCELRFVWAGQEVETGMYFLKAGGWDVADMPAVGDILKGAWDNHCRPVTATTCALTEIYMTNLESEFAFTYSYTTGLPLAGTTGTESLPNNCTLAFSFGTAGRGRSFRGRMYPPGIAEGYVSGNTVSSLWTDAWRDFHDIVTSSMLVLGGVHSVVSRISNGAPRIVGLSTPVLSATFKDTVIDSQRRRLPGRGS